VRRLFTYCFYNSSVLATRRFGLTITLAGTLLGSLDAQTLEGKVFEDHTGDPLASARVKVSRPGTPGLIADLDTDRTGCFHSARLPAGQYRLEVSKPNYLDVTLAASVTGESAAGRALAVRLVRLGVITGQVVDAQNRPIRGARVFPMTKPQGATFFQPGNPVLTNDQGQYRHYGLLPGEYAVAVSLASFGSGSSGAGSMFYPDNANPRIFAISGGEEYRNVDFAFLPSSLHSVSGVVNLAEPETNIRFVVALASEAQPSLLVAVEPTKADGSFQLQGVPAGSYYLFASGPVRGYGAGSAVLGPDPLFARTRIDLAVQDLTGVSLAPAKGRSARFVLRGETAQVSGSCPASATLTLRPLENWGAQTMQRINVSAANEQRVDNIAPGRYSLSVVDLGDACFSADHPVLDLEREDDPGTVAVLVTAAGSIHGRLVSSSAAPSAFAVVLVASGTAGGVRLAFPDAEGRFTFDGLRPGSYRIAAQPAASAERWVPDIARMFEVDVLGGAATELDLPAPDRQ
jgi:hypothetical protein